MRSKDFAQRNLVIESKHVQQRFAQRNLVMESTLVQQIICTENASHGKYPCGAGSLHRET